MTTLKKTWLFEDCCSIALYHNVVSGLRFVLVDQEEILSSGGISSVKKNLKEPGSFDEIKFQISDSKGDKVNVSVLIHPTHSQVSGVQMSEPYEYACVVTYENPCEVIEYSPVNGSLNWSASGPLSLVESC